MFSQYGKKLFKHSKDHQVFAISLPNLQEIGLKTHPNTKKKVDYDEVVKIASNQEKNYTLTGNYKFTGNLIVAAVPKKGSVLNYNYIIIDGVHRYKAAEVLDHPNKINFIVEVLRFDNMAKAVQEFQRINNIDPAPIHKITPNIEVGEAVDMFTINHPEYIPHSDDIKDTILESEMLIDLETADKLYDALLEIQDTLFKAKKSHGLDEDTMNILQEETAKQKLVDSIHNYK